MLPKVTLRSIHGKYLSAQQDGRAEWNRDIASAWENFDIEMRQGDKIVLKGAHGMYVSAQPDGSVQINRREAPPGGWEEFTIENRGNDIFCLKSCHGKYLSAQQNGTAQWNRDHAPRGGWEDIQIQTSSGQLAWAEPSRIQPASFRTSVETSSIDILEATTNKGVCFRINNPPRSNDAWVGIYPTDAPDQDHGEQNKRWKWLRDFDVNNASFLGAEWKGNWSIRIFSDAGFTLNERKDFFIHADSRFSSSESRSLPNRTQQNFEFIQIREYDEVWNDAGSQACLLYTSPSPRDQRGSRMPSSA